MNIKKLQKRLEKEYTPDGYVRIDRITTDFIEKDSIVEIIGAYGYKDADGEYHQQEFNIFFDGADRHNYEYIAGMFAQYIQNQDN